MTVCEDKRTNFRLNLVGGDGHKWISFAACRTPASGNDEQRLDTLIRGLVDVDTIMSTLPNAIRNAVAANSAR